MTSHHEQSKRPGVLWIFILGGIGFLTGFIGPMLVVPEANQGPLLGLFITGPGGAVLGLGLFLAFRFFPIAARRQWQVLSAVGIVSVVAILFLMQPSPATLGYVLEIEVKQQRAAHQVTEDVIKEWKARIAQVDWTSPRAGWEQQMRTALRDDRGVVVDAIVVRRKTLKVHRKPWNKGRIFSTPWQALGRAETFYFPESPAPVLSTEYFLPYDSSARIKGPKTWPPTGLTEFIGFSVLEAVPEEYRSF